MFLAFILKSCSTLGRVHRLPTKTPFRPSRNSQFSTCRPLLAEKKEEAKEKKDDKPGKDDKQGKDKGKEEKKEPKPYCAEPPPVLMDMLCKTAVITGGATGIGLAAAHEILSEKARQVALIGLDDSEGRAACTCLNNLFGNNKAVFFQASVGCVAELEAAFKKAHETLKNIDIVVNAAGIFNGAAWEKEIITNIVGTIRGTLLAYKFMSKDAGGCGGVLINIGGIHSLEPFPEAPTFCACSHAILGFTRSFGAPYHESRTNIRVVSLLPGFTKTDLFAQIKDKGMTDAMGADLKQALDKAKKQMPSVCGQAIGHLIKFGKSGTVWIIKGSNLCSTDIPDPKTYSKIVAQYIV